MDHRRTALVCTEPGGGILTLAEAKKQIRVEHDDDDDLITDLIAVASGHLDGADGVLKRSMRTQEWKLVLPSFRRNSAYAAPWDGFWGGCGDVFSTQHAQDRRILLPLPPAQSVGTIQYVDPDGATQTLDPALYSFVQCGTEPSFILPAHGQSWPSTRWQPNAVTIPFTAGYGDAETDVPANLRHAAKLHLSLLYENREAALVADRAAAVALPMGYDSLIYNYRMLRAR